MTITKLLIANRGEIACRVIETCQRLAITTVAVYSAADRCARHARLADHAFELDDKDQQLAYLNGEQIIQIAQQNGCQAIHPGYGFLSEQAQFAQACQDQGLIFIGPSARAIDAMGNKSMAKTLMAEAGVPMLPGYHGDDQSEPRLIQEADKIGYPLLIKAVYGGGGKGMRIVEQAEDLSEALSSARREAQRSFGHSELLLERYLTRPRHIEVQVFADRHGNVMHLFDRDCSLQRRHQKVLEEAPAPDLSEPLRWQMGETSVNAARAIDYLGAGTLEYLLDDKGRFYFIEMNTRLQVEHPVTEMICGQDLVAWQLAVANGDKLPLDQEQLCSRGHAIEVRLYAEDPSRDFIPISGSLSHVRWPSSVRIETGVNQGDKISAQYDPLIAKLISYGADRPQAIQQMRRALNLTQLDGLTTNLEFLQRILTAPAFAQAKLHTGFLTEDLPQPAEEECEIWPAAWATTLLLLSTMSADPIMAGWRLNAPAQVQLTLQDEHGEHFDIQLVRSGEYWTTTHDHQQYRLALQTTDKKVYFQLNDQLYTGSFIQDQHQLTLWFGTSGKRFKFTLNDSSDHAPPSANRSSFSTIEHALCAPMHGTFTANLVSVGERVIAKQTLAVMEAMKMEYPVRAPYAGVVLELPFVAGDPVQEGESLVVLSAKVD